MDPGPGRVLLGRISGLFGVDGWVKVYSYTEPPSNILEYSPWFVSPDWHALRLVSGRRQGRGLVALLGPQDSQLALADRNAAAGLVGAEIAIARASLPAPGPERVYWADLIGCAVRNAGGAELGRVSDLMATGAHDLLIVSGERERLIPFVRERFVLEIDLAARVITVDWDCDF